MPKTSHPANQPGSAVIIGGIMLALTVWGAYLAIGGYQAAVQQHSAAPPWLRALVIFGCTAGFLGFWALMLLIRQRRLAAEEKDE